MKVKGEGETSILEKIGDIRLLVGKIGKTRSIFNTIWEGGERKK